MPRFHSPETLVDYLLDCYFVDIKQEIESNYDADRFNTHGVDRSCEPYTALHKDTFKALLRHSEDCFNAYKLFDNDAEKQLYLDLIRYRLAGHRHVKLPTNTQEFWQKRQQAKAVPYQVEQFNEKGTLFKNCYSFDLRWLDKDLKVISLGAEWPFFHKQYFFERPDLIIKPEKGDYVIDAGSCLGDTSIAFGAAVGQEGFVYLFDFIPAHNEIAQRNIDNNSELSRFKIFEQGLSDTIFTPEHNKAHECGYEPGFELPHDNQSFPTTTLDYLVQTKDIERVDFIKMDIEGSELKALQGATETLRQFRPKLAISLYHKSCDFYEIPLFIKNLDLGYRFALGHYTIHAGETVLYATTR